MKINIKYKNPYSAVIEEIRRLAPRTKEGYEYLSSKIVRIRTSVLGESNEYLDVTSSGDYIFENDWYEGGDVELLGFIDVDDIDVPLIKEEVASNE